VSGVNNPPTVGLANGVATLPENSDTTAGIKMADIVITDDGMGSNDLTLTGADAGLFEIVGSELWLKAGTVLDHETNPVLDVTVEVDDAATPGSPDDSTSLMTTITDVNEAPELDLDANDSGGQSAADFAATFSEGGGPVAIADSDALLSDVDDTHLASLVVTITNLQDGADELLSADTGTTAVTASYVGGVLTLSGTDTLAHYQQILRTIEYQNTKVDPNTTDRVITFAAHDGTNASNTATTTVAIVPDNRLVVTTTLDVADGDTTNIATLLANNPDGLISLREAIEATNGTPNGVTPDEIHFHISDPLVGGAHTIVVSSGGLPDINDAVIIDGTTEPDFARIRADAT
jgi:hypothetical protein